MKTFITYQSLVDDVTTILLEREDINGVLSSVIIKAILALFRIGSTTQILMMHPNVPPTFDNSDLYMEGGTHHNIMGIYLPKPDPAVAIYKFQIQFAGGRIGGNGHNILSIKVDGGRDSIMAEWTDKPMEYYA